MQWDDVTHKILGGLLEGPGKLWGEVAPPGTPLAHPLH